jgi:prepilin-type N-terminal cleavage/methylation domain-containing protein
LLLQRQQQRSGFTLLEVVLASSLAVILMGALYVALDIQLRLADAGREAVEEAILVRQIFNRFNNDLSSGLGPVNPPISSTTTTSTSTTQSTTGTGTGTGSTGSTTTGDVAVETVESTFSSIPFQAGVIGDSTRLTLFLGRVTSNNALVEGAPTADIRRVTYWFVDGKGLAWQEITAVTAERLRNSSDPDIVDGKQDEDYVISSEVVGLQFEYWSGTTWDTSWDGSELGTDGKSPKGPPMAIRVILTLSLPGPDGVKENKEFRHTFAILGAPGLGTSDTDAAASQSTTTTTGQ